MCAGFLGTMRVMRGRECALDRFTNACDSVTDTSGTPSESDVMPPQARGAQLDRSLLHGVAWTAGVKWLSQLLSWPATFVVVRLLSPTDYGLVAMGSVYVGLVSLVNEFGLGSAVIKHRGLSSHQISQLNTLCVVFGTLGCLATVAAAYPLALFYRTPAVTLVVVALSINFLITSFKTIPLSLLQRDLQFRLPAINEAVGSIIQSVSLVLFAYFGFRYWALVIAFLLSSITTTLLTLTQRPHRFAWPVLGEVRDSVAFGSHLVGSRIGWYLYTNSDFFIIGRVLGQMALGSYSFGWSFATAPVEKVTALIGSVTPPVFSAVQHDLPALRRYVTKLTGGIAFLTIPAGVGLALVTHDFVAVALGTQWLDAVQPLRLLAVFAAVRSVVPILSQAGLAVGLSRFIMRNSIASALVMPIAFFVGTRWGTSGVAASWLVAYPFVAIPLFVVVARHIEMRIGDYLASLWPSLSSAAIMVPVVMLVHSFDASWAPAARLATESLAGALAYGAAVMGLHRAEVRGALALFRTIRAPIVVETTVTEPPV